MERPFLTARWENLVLLNCPCPGQLLARLVPRGTELDPWQGQHIVSLVGFRFLQTRIRGLAIPGHRDFSEVNLRFYVRRAGPDGEMRRAVVFIREVVPHRAIAWTARMVYNEPYETAAMSHDVRLDPSAGGSARYGWSVDGQTHQIEVRAEGAATAPEVGSEAEFITEHYWGYTRQRDGSTLEYRVAHPSLLVWSGVDASYIASPGARLYGADFAAVLSQRALSCYVAVGSDVEVYPGGAIA